MNPIMSRLQRMPRQTLEEFVLKVVDLCYLVEDEQVALVYDLEGDINGGDLVEGLTQLLDHHGLTPPVGAD